MTIVYTNTIDNFYELDDLCWGGARETLKIVEEHDLEDEFFEYVATSFDYCDTPPTNTEINDFIWFECDDWLDKNIENEGDN